MKKTLIMCLLTSFAVAAGADTIVLDNPDFETGGGSDAWFWEQLDGAGVNSSPSNYREDVGFGTGQSMNLKADGGNHIWQALDVTDVGAMDATTYNDFTIGFKFGQRQDAAASTLRISLWNNTTDTELAGVVQVITSAAGVWGGTGSWNLIYDNTAQTAGDIIALRVTNIDPDLEGNAWGNTATIDDVTVTAIPEPATMGLVAAFGGGILFIRRKLMI